MSGMVILHNRHDEASREFVADAPADVQVLDFYDDTDRQAWLDAGGTLALRAFPSVLFRHDVRTSEDPETGDLTTEPPGWDVADTPESLETPLPAVGEPCPVGLYRYGEGWVYCRQAHTRMAYAPEDTPALFSTWRPESERVIWIANEAVSVGDVRQYGGLEYSCLQAHTTQEDWTPPSVPALWALVTQPGEGWQPGLWYAAGDLVDYDGAQYECLQAHMSQAGWEPPAVPALWRVVTAPSAEWQPYVAYTIGDEVTYNGALYRCRQSHTSFPGWEPPNVLALWLPIVE